MEASFLFLLKSEEIENSWGKVWQLFSSYSNLGQIQIGTLDTVPRREVKQAKLCTCPEEVTEEGRGSRVIMFWSVPKNFSFAFDWSLGHHPWSHQLRPWGRLRTTGLSLTLSPPGINVTSGFVISQASMKPGPEVGQGHGYMNGLSACYRSFRKPYRCLKKQHFSRSCSTDHWCSTELVSHFPISQKQHFNYVFFFPPQKSPPWFKIGDTGLLYSLCLRLALRHWRHNSWARPAAVHHADSSWWCED